MAELKELQKKISTLLYEQLSQYFKQVQILAYKPSISSLHTPFYTVPLERCVQVEKPQNNQVGGGGFVSKIVEKIETFVNHVVDTIENYLTPEEIAAGYF